MNDKNSDLFLILGGAGLAILLEILGVGQPILRQFLAIPLVFIFPGYALGELVLPRHRLRGPELWALRTGFSIIVTLAGGFLLNLTPSGLQPSTWAWWLGGFTLVAALLALLKRKDSTGFTVPLRIKEPKPYQIALGAIALVFAVSAVGFASLTTQALAPGTTRLWIRPTGQTQTTELRLGVSNNEKNTASYILEIHSQGQEIQRWSVDNIQPGEVWELSIVIPQEMIANNQPVQALLYRADDPGQVYRQVTWWPQAARN